jgi:hypothetical protein
MIAVYTGKMPSITIAGIQYDRNVPTYVKPLYYESIKDRLDFEEYDKKKKYDGNPRYVNLVLPSHFDMFLASLSIIDRMREWFPTCPVRVHCDRNFYHLIPKDVAIANNIRPVANSDIYRDFNLHLSTFQRYKMAMDFPKLNLEQLLLIKIKMYNGKYDSELKPAQIGSYNGGNNIVVFGKGDGNSQCIPGLGKELSNALPNVKYFEHVDYSKAPEYFEALKGAKYAIFCGETDFSFIAPYMGIPSVIAVGNTRPGKDRLLDWFNNVTITYVNDQKYAIPEFVSKIRQVVGESGSYTPKPKKEKKIEKVSENNEGSRKDSTTDS